MTVSYQDYVNEIRSPVSKRILKVNVLDENYNIVSSIEPKIIDGSISLSSDSGSRRSATLVLDNTDGEFFPNPGGQLWLNTKIQLFSGYEVNNEQYYVSRGIFLVGEVELSSQSGSEQITTVNLYDQYSAINGQLSGSIPNTYIIPVNTEIEVAIKQVMLDAGETRSVLIEPLNAEISSSTIILEAGGTFSELIEKFCNMTSRLFYYDNNGFPRFESPINSIENIFNSGSVWDFSTNDILYLGGSRKYEFSKVRNACTVIGSSINGLTYRATSLDNNPLSPTRIDLINRRDMVILDDVIYSTELCQQRSDYELQKAIQVLEEISVECVPIDVIEGDSVITILNENIGLSTADRYLVRSVNFPLLNSTMSMTIWKARSFN